MKRIILFLAVGLLTCSGFAQKKATFTEDDAKQFYRTMQGDYTGVMNDTITLMLHLTPIWEREGDRFHWLYMEVDNIDTKTVVEQKIIELKPFSDIAFKVVVHDIAKPERFAGMWSNRNFFDGFNTSILKRNGKFQFMKTMDFEYQTGWNSRKNLKCFPSGDRIHFKFVQEDERLYVKRVPKHSSDIIGIIFFKELTD